MANGVIEKAKRDIGKRTGNTAQFTLWLPPRDMTALKALALANNTNPTEIMRRLIKRYIAQAAINIDEEAA